LEALGTAFKTVRAKEPAVETYRILLENGEGRNNILERERWSNEIARIYLNWLDYPQAGTAYENLLEIQLQIQNLRDEGELPPPPPPPPGETETAPPSQIESLKELAFIYEQMGELLQAIAARERLIGYYVSQANLIPVPEQKLAIASNYEQLGKFQQAGQAYQEAYQVATTIQQFDNASIALEKLAKLYRAQNQIQTALELYQAQVLVNQQSYNFYGMMNAYDSIGEIYREQEAYPQALQAFQSGLQLAQQLKYKEDYFSAKIDEVNRKINR
jgi:tetratricopeptide (TPR) repeat protein